MAIYRPFDQSNSVTERRSQAHTSHSCSHNTQLRTLGQLCHLLFLVTKLVCIGHRIGMGEGIEEGIWPSKARVPLESPCEVVKFLSVFLDVKRCAYADFQVSHFFGGSTSVTGEPWIGSWKDILKMREDAKGSQDIRFFRIPLCSRE